MRPFFNLATDKRFLSALLFVAVAANACAGTLIKANNANLLNDVNSWVGGTATPGSGDIAQWDSTVTAANSVGLGTPANWSGILLNNPGGLVTITNDVNSLTLGAGGIDLSLTNNGLTLLCPIILANLPVQTWTVFTNRTLLASNFISGAVVGVGLVKAGPGTLNLYATNTYTGPTTVNAGTLTLTSGSLAAGSSVKINTGGSLSLFGVATINGPVEIGTNTTATQNASISGKILGNVTIDPGSTNVTPTASGIYTSPASGYVQANFSASLSAGGYITNQGVLNLTGNGSLSLGTIVGPGSDAAGNLGGILDSNTNSKSITLGNGSAFAYYKPAGGIPGTTLQIAGNGSAFIKWFGYNDAAGISPYTNTLNGGTWTFANIGQNNSSAHYIGVCTVSNGATVFVTNNISYSHGSWIIVSNSSMTFNQSGKSLAPGHPASNIGLNLSVSNSGTLYVGGNGLSLGYQSGNVYNTANEYNSLNIGKGGAVYVTNTFNVGSGQADNQAGETNTVNLAGGKLLVTGTLAPGAGINTQSNTPGWTPVPPVNVFNWTAGQLTAATITVSNGLVIQNVTNNSGGGFFVTNPAVFFAGNFSSTALTNTAGTLAPGDVGAAGKTTINKGDYVQEDGATLDIDIGGTNVATAFQHNSAPADGSGWYDDLNVSTGTFYAGGTLHLRFINGFIPTQTQQFVIINYSNISGNFTNLTPVSGSLGRVAVENGTPGATFNVVSNSNHTAIYLNDYKVTAAQNSAPTNTLAQVQNILGTNTVVITGSGGSGSSGYTILSTTNLTTPLANWVTNATGLLFGTGGSVNYTNAINSASLQEFYRVRVP